MNMKTAEDFLREKGWKDSDFFDSVISFDQVVELIEEYSQFKSLSPVSQQFVQLCPKCGGEGILPNSGLSSSVHRQCDVCYGSKVFYTTQLSVSPDAQKDETPLQVYKRNLKLQNEISELKEKIKIIVDESNIVAEKLSEATSFANEQANKAHEYSMKLTSKESDVKMAVEALEMSKLYMEAVANAQGYSPKHLKPYDMCVEALSSLKGNK